MLAPVCTWIAIRGVEIQDNLWDLLPAVVVGFAVLFWVGGFDIIYACQDTDFDQQAELKSIPVKFGVARALQLAAFSHFLMIAALACLAWIPQMNALGWIYYISVAAVAVLLLVEHALVKPDDLERVNVAFFQINALISVGLFLIVSIDLLL